MRRDTRSRRFVPVLVAGCGVVVLLGSTAIAGGAQSPRFDSRTSFPGIPSAAGVFAACYDLVTYRVRLVRADEGCERDVERRAS